MKDTLKKRWLVDAALLIGFLICFFLNMTGVTLHQWLGIAAGALAAYHLLAHSNWVKTVTRRLLGKTSAQARLYYLIDALLLAGFAVMIGTGLVISTWLNLALVSYATWRTVHILSAMMTLLVTVLKIGLHEGWILSVGRRVFAPAAARPQQVGGQVRQPNTQMRRPVGQAMNRRAFLGLMGGVGIASLFAFSQSVQTLTTNSSTQPAADTSAAGTTSASSIAVSSSTTGCTVSCTRGPSGGCPFPGRCRRYQDTNGNSRCDLGECA